MTDILRGRLIYYIRTLFAAHIVGQFFVNYLSIKEGRWQMKKKIFLQGLILSPLVLTVAFPVYADSAGVTQIQTFIQSVIQVLVTLAGLASVGFFAWGGFGYITSTGNPEALDRSKKTILYSGIGLVIVLGAFVLSNIVTQLATTAFGASH